MGQRSFVSVHVLCTQQVHYPCVESVMHFASIQPFVHDLRVHVIHRPVPGARPVFSVFKCFYKRHKRLPLNSDLNVQGDLVIMRVATKNLRSVIDMEESDREVADFVAES